LSEKMKKAIKNQNPERRGQKNEKDSRGKLRKKGHDLRAFSERNAEKKWAGKKAGGSINEKVLSKKKKKLSMKKQQGGKRRRQEKVAGEQKPTRASVLPPSRLQKKARKDPTG